ncbi:Protein arginine methyltransferase NDUFAF7, mitochondrial [Erysiphe neolycopersici]|uniref:Protein arginine methyltransferase NDUFAF7 n=1 Tax=Erysiphe neolycopersici TaxID=212602 RepID=A0A420I030_9PEZI|nr:Protein arginine methyltransferase NDUFAF7, mitochondrial [Erysiphe neolycopersici]
MKSHILSLRRDGFLSSPTCRIRRLFHSRWMSTQPRKWSTPLAKQLFEAISTTGPIPLATYMRMCLTADQDGYYMSNKSSGQDQFGVKGDFITSPEISQIFGELIGIWFVAEWIAQKKQDKRIELIEVGPGRGTLMDDILRTIRNFKQMSSRIDAIYLIETSPSLRNKQKDILCGDAPLENIPIGYCSISKYMQIPITWVDNIRFIPSENDKTTFIVAHEFFDALPIHAFQSVEGLGSSKNIIGKPIPEGQFLNKVPYDLPHKEMHWREMVVSPTQESLQDSSEFQLTLSKKSTPHSLYLPEISARYKNLKKIAGSVIEISPESHVYAQEFARRIGGTSSAPKSCPSGAAIILDYGPLNTIPINSLRGICGHKRVSPFSSPGLVDLSADVDFFALAEAALAASPGVEVYGPVEQASFLLSMGIRERAEMLLNKAGDDNETKKRVKSSWERLVDRGVGGMGKIYKAMAIVPLSKNIRRPVGFGGNLSS